MEIGLCPPIDDNILMKSARAGDEKFNWPSPRPSKFNGGENSPARYWIFNVLIHFYALDFSGFARVVLYAPPFELIAREINFFVGALMGYGEKLGARIETLRDEFTFEKKSW